MEHYILGGKGCFATKLNLHNILFLCPFKFYQALGIYTDSCVLQGAKMIVEDGCGFPNTVSGLRKIKGIGEYTAGAIASIAFNEVNIFIKLLV